MPGKIIRGITMRKLILIFILLTSVTYAYDYPSRPHSFAYKQIIPSSKVQANDQAPITAMSAGTNKVNFAEVYIQGTRVIDDSRNYSGGNMTITGNLVISSGATTLNNLYCSGNITLSGTVDEVNIASLNATSNILQSADITHNYFIQSNISSINLLQATDVTHNAGIQSNISSINALQASMSVIEGKEIYNITDAEAQQVQNINSNTISTAQWGYVGNADQALKTTDSPTFNELNLTNDLNIATNKFIWWSNDGSGPSGYILFSESNERIMLVTSDGSASAYTYFYPTGVDFEKNVTINGTLNVTEDIASVAKYDYSSTSTVVGWSSFSTKRIDVKKVGKTVYVDFFIRGTSNSTFATFTVPYAVSERSDFAVSQIEDNGGVISGHPFGYVEPTLDKVTIGIDLTINPWTSSGTKAISGQFFYETTD